MDVSQFDQKDVEYGQQEFIRKTGKAISALTNKMRKQLPAKIEYTKDDMLLDNEINRMLGEQKIFEEEALGKDRLQALNRAFHLIQIVVDRDSGDIGGKRSTIDEKLGELKLNIFQEKIRAYRCEESEIAFKAIAALKKHVGLCKGRSDRVHILPEDEAPLATSNDGDLYVFCSPPHDYTVYLAKKQTRPSQLKLKISLLCNDNSSALHYIGRLEGMVEVGSDAQTFCIVDQERQAPKQDDAQINEILGAIEAFLKNTGIREIYLFLQKFFEENKSDIENRQYKQDALRIRRIIKGMDEIF
jgi:hypothetical protein